MILFIVYSENLQRVLLMLGDVSEEYYSLDGQPC
jgi:hypothetical protein